MEIGFLAHVTHNIALIVAYGLLGTLYLPGFIKRLDIPERRRRFFKASCFTFFLLCAYTHAELLIHINELPPDYFTFSHNVAGWLQAIGAFGLLWVLHPLIKPKREL